VTVIFGDIREKLFNRCDVIDMHVQGAPKKVTPRKNSISLEL